MVEKIHGGAQGVPSGDPSRNNKAGKSRGRNYSEGVPAIGMRAQISTIKSDQAINFSAKKQDTTIFVSGTNWAMRRMYKG